MAKGSPKSRLNAGQQRLLKELTKGGRIQDAGRRAGYASPQSTSQALANVREKAPEILNRINLGLDVSLKRYLKPLLEAKETVFFQNQGIVTDQREVACLDIRMRATENLLKIHGAYPRGTNGNTDGSGVEVNVNIGALGPGILEQICALVEVGPAGTGEAEGRDLPPRTIDVAPRPRTIPRPSKDPR